MPCTTNISSLVAIHHVKVILGDMTLTFQSVMMQKKRDHADQFKMWNVEDSSIEIDIKGREKDMPC